jgi:hypothetical protein
MHARMDNSLSPSYTTIFVTQLIHDMWVWVLLMLLVGVVGVGRELWMMMVMGGMGTGVSSRFWNENGLWFSFFFLFLLASGFSFCIISSFTPFLLSLTSFMKPLFPLFLCPISMSWILYPPNSLMSDFFSHWIKRLNFYR